MYILIKALRFELLNEMAFKMRHEIWRVRWKFFFVQVIGQMLDTYATGDVSRVFSMSLSPLEFGIQDAILQ